MKPKKKDGDLDLDQNTAFSMVLVKDIRHVNAVALRFYIFYLCITLLQGQEKYDEEVL